jgi:PAS domain S-box-containing protein
MSTLLANSSQLSVWSQLIHAITQTESLDEIYQAALDALASGLGVQRASILLFDHDGSMRFKAWRGLSQAYRHAVEGHTPWSPQVKGAQPIAVPNVSEDASLTALMPVLQEEGIAALAFIPLEGGDGVIGKFMLYYDAPHTFAPEELELASLIAVQVAFAVERARAHQTIRESAGAAQRLAAIVESSDDAILSKDLNGVITSWNAGAERMFGYSAAEVIGRSIAIIIPPDRLDEEVEVLARIRSGQPVEMETVRRRKDGSLVDISLKVSPVKDDEGRIVGASKIARDISTRLRTGAELADLFDQLRMERNAAESARRQAAFLADAGSILSRSLDYEQTLVEVARLAVPEIADWCAVDIVNKEGGLQRLTIAHADPSKVPLAHELMRKYPPDPKQPGGLMDVIRTGKPAMMESVPLEWLAARAHDDEHLRILVEYKLTSYICVPLVSASGTLGAMTFAYAESGRHYTQRDLFFAEDLAARAALAFENALAYRRAHDANRLKDEFLATLSHELRTPLNAIVGYAHMLSMGILDDERQAKAIAVVKRNSEALGQIIADVLDVSRITSGKLRLDVRPVDLEDLLRNAVATMQPAADAKNVSLELRVHAPVGKASGDPDRLQQVVWNLLSNAVKFTAPGGHVHIGLAQTDDSVEVIVRDNGQGIDPSFLPHIFERFRLADSRSSREYGGLGLGLAIVRELIELHGGSVSAASEGLGKGATFRVRLPRTMAESRPADRGAKVFTPSPDQELPRLLRGVRILAVDDEEDALGLLRVVLETAGAEVVTARSAHDAVELLKCSHYHIVIADLAMPLTDGFELIRTIREKLPPPANRIPAAALTAYARSEDRLSALASGFQAHIAKPVNPTELVLAVAALLGR